MVDGTGIVHSALLQDGWCSGAWWWFVGSSVCCDLFSLFDTAVALNHEIRPDERQLLSASHAL